MRKPVLFFGLSAATIFICAIGFQQRRVYAQSQYNVLQYQLYPSFPYNTLKYPTGLAMVSGVGLLIADSGNHVIRSFSSGSLGVWAGAVGVSGYVDGPPATARFNHPASISVYEDSSVLYVFINDTKNYVVRLHTEAFGYNQVTTLAGLGGTSGFADGKGSNARFSYVAGASNSSNPNPFICDSGNHSIRQVGTDGTTSTYAGNGSPGLANGYRTSAQFNCPAKVTWDSAGNMYVADAGNNVIRKIDTSGNVTTFAGTEVQGYTDGPGSSAQFDMPCSIVFNSADNSLYVSDSLNSVIRKITLGGVVSTYAGSSQGQGGLVNGSLTQAKFVCPMDLLISNGIMYVADAGNNAIRSIDMVHGVVSTYLD